jgi:hypothetical protein
MLIPNFKVSIWNLISRYQYGILKGIYWNVKYRIGW